MIPVYPVAFRYQGTPNGKPLTRYTASLPTAYIKSLSREVPVMKGLKLSVFGYFLDGLVQYFAEPIGRIFGPDDDNYPEIGVQPFEGDTHAETVEIL
jgi:hypothetical protein